MENKQLKTLLPYNIQFFADDGEPGNGSAEEQPNASQTPGTGQQTSESPAETTGLTLEQAMAELAAERAEKARFKASIDKLTHENKELTASLRQRMTASEQEELAKQEQAEQQKAYIEELEAFKRRTEAKDRYMRTSGMSAELAEKAADAEVKGDMDALANIQKQHSDAQIKAKEAEWLGSRPRLNSGDGNAYSSMTKEEILAITDVSERQRAIAMNIELFQ